MDSAENRLWKLYQIYPQSKRGHQSSMERNSWSYQHESEQAHITQLITRITRRWEGLALSAFRITMSWYKLALFDLSCWNLLHLQVPLQATILEIIDSLAAQLHTPIFMNILILLCWTIWCARNGAIFENQSASLPNYKVFFKKEITLLLHLVKHKQQERLEERINSFG